MRIPGPDWNAACLVSFPPKHPGPGERLLPGGVLRKRLGHGKKPEGLLKGPLNENASS